MYVVEVVIEHPVRHLDMTFSYLSRTEIPCGVRVHVPFGYQKLVGYVKTVHFSSLNEKELNARDGITYRYISDVIDHQTILTDELEKLAEALSKMTFSPLVSCLKTMLPPSLKPSSKAKITSKQIKYVVFQKQVPSLTAKQQSYLDDLENKHEEPLKEATVSRDLIKRLENLGAVVIEKREIMREVTTLQTVSESEKNLNQQQQTVLNKLFELDQTKPFLLHGITGSGKTEVYLQATKKMVAQGKQVLMLVPEISLTPQMVAMFQSRFHHQVAILHSRLSDGQRYDEYRRILNREVDIVVGARSAVFAPLHDIGLIILDEEHDASYKQNNSPCYHTRDVAIWRMRYHQARLLLGSASPSVESYAKARAGKYHLLELTTRATQTKLSNYQIIDMAKEAKSGNLSMFSRAFQDGLNQALKQGKQALVLVNRRGYATYLLCKDCGYVPKCPHCEVSLTYHKQQQVLRCHYCGYEQPYQKACPQCGSKMVSYRGAGTEQMEEVLAKEFPDAKIIRFDLDTTRNKDAHEKLLNAFKAHQGNVLLGTQMIAKGLDLADVMFVGVLDGDSALNLPDYRASERTFQLLLQVAGRAGRHQDGGQVVIQTYNPKHYAIVAGAKQDYRAFYQEEIKMRQLSQYPPYCYLMSILFTGKDEQTVQATAISYARYLKQHTQANILGPSPALIARINDAYRYRIMIKYVKSNTLFACLEEALHQNQGQVKVEVDVNPYNQM